MYPITYNFKKIALTNKVTTTNASGQVMMYSHQKLLKLKEKIVIYQDVNKTSTLGELNADRVIDFSPIMTFTNAQGQPVLSVKRLGGKSIWKATYEASDSAGNVVYTVQEKDPWVKVIDGLIGQAPILGWFSGYFFNPQYIVLNSSGQQVAELTKKPAFMESNFILQCADQAADPSNLLPITMLIVSIRERMRG